MINLGFKLLLININRSIFSLSRHDNLKWSLVTLLCWWFPVCLQTRAPSVRWHSPLLMFLTGFRCSHRSHASTQAFFYVFNNGKFPTNRLNPSTFFVKSARKSRHAIIFGHFMHCCVKNETDFAFIKLWTKKQKINVAPCASLFKLGNAREQILTFVINVHYGNHLAGMPLIFVMTIIHLEWVSASLWW